MLTVIFLVGFILGIVITTVVIFAYTAAIEMREEEERQIREQKRIQREMRNAQRDRMSQSICDQAQKGLQRREEG